MATSMFSDMGKTDVLVISSEPASSNPLVVSHRPSSGLTHAEVVKLENQGVGKESHAGDCSIMKARYGLDKDCYMWEVEQGRISTVEVRRKIATLFSITKNPSVIIHYTGPGKKGTGDWCFSDGFITFRDIMALYIAHKRPSSSRPVLFIGTDCAYSGNWTVEAMNYLDDKKIGPCGHAAKAKDIQLSVQASCLSTEVPQKFAFSTHSIYNDKNTGCVCFRDYYRNKAIAENQHPKKVNFNSIMCQNAVDQPCTMAPDSTWKMWRESERLCIIADTDNIQPKWNAVLFVDDEKIICEFLADHTRTDVTDHVHVLKSGWGKEPPNDIKQWLQLNYRVDYEHRPEGTAN